MCDVADLKDVSMERGVCRDRQPIHVEHCEGQSVPSTWAPLRRHITPPWLDLGKRGLSWRS